MQEAYSQNTPTRYIKMTYFHLMAYAFPHPFSVRYKAHDVIILTRRRQDLSEAFRLIWWLTHMRLDPRSLRLFIQVIETGSIAKAAERCFIAPSAISKRISEMEQLINTPLLKRNNRGVEPTEAGRVLLQLARRVLHQLDDIYSQMHEFAHGVRGQVRMVANISAICQFLPRQLRSFLNQYPQVQVHLEEKISDDVIRLVAEDAADIGIFTAPSTELEHPKLHIYPYKTDRLVVITTPNHPLSEYQELHFAQTLGHDYVGLHTGSAINNQILAAATDANETLRMRIQVTSYEALCGMVETGLGIGLMPHDVARAYLQAGRVSVIPLLDHWASRELKLCVRRSETTQDSTETPMEATAHLLNHLRTT